MRKITRNIVAEGAAEATDGYVPVPDTRLVRNRGEREEGEGGGREGERPWYKLEKLEQLEKLEKPERECHVSMETWWGNSASGLAGSISSRLLPCSNVNVLYIFPSLAREPFSPGRFTGGGRAEEKKGGTSDGSAAI